jgi:hypothetical protein
MKASLLVMSILLFSRAVSAQELPLGISEEKLMDVLGHPDSIVQGYDYYHHQSHGRQAQLIAAPDDSSRIGLYQERIYEHDSIRRLSLFDSLLTQVSQGWPNRLTFGEPKIFQLWLSSDSIFEIVHEPTDVFISRFLRATTNISFDSTQPQEDDQFEMAHDLKPLDAEACVVANTWRCFLELEPYRPEKYYFWSRHDPLIAEYLPVPYQGDFSEQYSARLTGIVKDPDLGGYILSTTFFSVDTAGLWDYEKLHGVSRQITYMKREDGFWKIVSPVYYLTKDWSTRRVGNITYHYPQKHIFNDSIARAAVHYFDSVSMLFNSEPLKHIDYYYCCPGDNAYSILGINTPANAEGRTSFENCAIFSCDTSECFNHELVHLAIRREDTLNFIMEGIASFMGDDTSSFFANCKSVGRFLQARQSFTFDSMVAIDFPDSVRYLSYATGSMFFHNVFKVAGMEGVVNFYKLSINDSGFYKAVEKYLRVKKKGIDKYWRAEIAKYGANSNEPNGFDGVNVQGPR